MSVTPIKFFDRIKDQTSTTGTGDVTLAASPPTGYRAFGSVLSNNDYCYYVIDDGAGGWESGIGKYLTSGPTLQRITVFESSNSGSLVSFASGAKSVFIDMCAKALKQYTARAPHYTPFLLGADDDEFDDDNFSGWTLVDDGTHTPTVVEQNDMSSFSLPGSDTSGHIHAYMKAATVNTNDYIEACIQCMSKSQNYNLAGLVMADGVTYNSGTQMLLTLSQSESNTLAFNRHTGYNTQTNFSPIGLSAAGGIFRDNYFIRLLYAGSSNWSAYVSPDGISWSLAGTDTLTFTPSKIGFFVSTYGGSGPGCWSFRYFRHSS